MKKLEIALVIGFVIAVLCGVALAGEQQALAGKLLRLHVVANSDNQADQTLKLRVRDRVLAETGALTDGDTDLSAAREKLERSLERLSAVARDEIAREGYDYDVRVSVEPVWFSTREYEGFALPAGTYDALCVEIGEGAGKNWWCVVFPPLCAAAATGTLDETAAVAGLTERERLLIGEQGGYALKFQSIEWIEQAIAWVDGVIGP